jgi:hypothetical protein
MTVNESKSGDNLWGLNFATVDSRNSSWNWSITQDLWVQLYYISWLTVGKNICD